MPGVQKKSEKQKMEFEKQKGDRFLQGTGTRAKIWKLLSMQKETNVVFPAVECSAYVNFYTFFTMHTTPKAKMF